jgi:tRNA threonylcarbamoyladenosine biosynthesis protein TsaB
MILGIDTATATASVALVEDGKLVLEEIRSAPRHGAPAGRGNHAEILLPAIETVLSKTGLSLSAISAFAVSIGPGSFTGLRIGLSTVKGLVYGSEIPVVGIPTLAAIARKVTAWDGLICPFLDARKKEVYAALFRQRAGALERLTEDLVCSAEAVIERVAALDGGEPCLFIGDGIESYGKLITAALGDRSRVTLGEVYPSTACAVAQLGEARLARQERDPVGAMVPLYLRPSEAELKKGLLKG